MTTPRTSPAVRDCLSRVRDLMRARGSPCFLVGGWLRDQLLGRPVTRLNIDLAVPAHALTLSQALPASLHGAFVPLDEAAGCARVVVDTADGHLELDISDFRGRTLEEDLARRDFTINAIAVELEAWLRHPERPSPLEDPLHGQQALQQRRLIACFPQTFEADPVRILRAFRFAADLQLEMAEELPALIRAATPQLRRVSGERLRDELLAIVQTNRAGWALTQLNDVGALDVLLPELAPGRDMDQGPFHHLDVLGHQLETVAQGDRIMADFAEFSADLREPLMRYMAVEPVEHRSRKALVKLAGLLHDVGKPGTRRIKPDGDIWFLGHEQFGAELVESVTTRLRLSNREAEMIRRLVLYHLRPGHLSREATLTRRAIFRFFRDLEDDGPACVITWWIDRMATRGPGSHLDQIDQQRGRAEELLRAYFFKPEEAVRPPKLLDGHELMRALQLSPGPLVGELLRAIEEAQAEGAIRSKDEALSMARDLLRARP